MIFLCRIVCGLWVNNAPEKILLNLVLILLGQNSRGKNLLQRCLNTPWTTLYRLTKSLCNIVFEAPGNITQENSVYIIVVLIPLEQHWTGQNPMQCCLRVYRQHTTGKNPVQCCVNTPGIILHRKNPQYCLRGSRQHCTGKNPIQCLLNTIWSLPGDFYFRLVNFLLISGCCKYHINIV